VSEQLKTAAFIRAIVVTLEPWQERMVSEIIAMRRTGQDPQIMLGSRRRARIELEQLKARLAAMPRKEREE
jgi:hypothetical protein